MDHIGNDMEGNVKLDLRESVKYEILGFIQKFPD
jgi:hypothetical protein